MGWMRDNFIAESEFLHDQKKPPLGKGMFVGNVNIIAGTAQKKRSLANFSFCADKGLGRLAQRDEAGMPLKI